MNIDRDIESIEWIACDPKQPDRNAGGINADWWPVTERGWPLILKVCPLVGPIEYRQASVWKPAPSLQKEAP